MQYVTQRAMLIKGDRVPKGTTIELTPEEAKPLALHLIGAAVEETPEPEPTPEKPLEEMSAAELKEKADSLGLSTSGTKADLLERITLHLEGGAEELSEDNDQ